MAFIFNSGWFAIAIQIKHNKMHLHPNDFQFGMLDLKGAKDYFICQKYNVL